jgi:hypothetical protein
MGNHLLFSYSRTISQPKLYDTKITANEYIGQGNSIDKTNTNATASTINTNAANPIAKLIIVIFLPIVVGIYGAKPVFVIVIP